jgi:hypothetical protein
MKPFLMGSLLILNLYFGNQTNTCLTGPLPLSLEESGAKNRPQAPGRLGAPQP